MGAPQLVPDRLPVPVLVGQFVGPDRHPVELIEQADIGEFLDGVRQGVYAHAHLADLG